jgi:hypothetical protein
MWYMKDLLKTSGASQTRSLRWSLICGVRLPGCHSGSIQIRLGVALNFTLTTTAGPVDVLGYLILSKRAAGRTKDLDEVTGVGDYYDVLQVSESRLMHRYVEPNSGTSSSSCRIGNDPQRA